MNLKKVEWYLRVNLVGLGPRLMKKRIYWAAVLQRLRNTAIAGRQEGTNDMYKIRNIYKGVAVMQQV